MDDALSRLRADLAALDSERTLTLADRCDRCSAAATRRVRNDAGRMLQFCGHDYRKHEPALAVQGWQVIAARNV